MAWLTYSEYSTLHGLSRSSLERAARNETIPTHLDASGHRLFWSGEDDAHGLALKSILEELAELRAELREMRTSRYEFNTAVETAAREIEGDDQVEEFADDELQDEPPAAELVRVARPRTRRELPPPINGAIDHDAILERIDMVWSRGDCALSRELGFTDSWIAKARGGRSRSSLRKTRARWAAVVAKLDEVEALGA